MAFAPSKGRNIRKSEPVELDMTPIMNLFITIIPMLLTMMVTIQLSVISLNFASATGGGGAGAGAGGGGLEKEVKLVLYKSGFELRDVSGAATNIPAVEAGVKYNYFELDRALAAAKAKSQQVSTVKIVPYPDVTYDTLIRAIDVCKLNGFPTVSYSKPTTKYFSTE